MVHFLPGLGSLGVSYSVNTQHIPVEPSSSGGGKGPSSLTRDLRNIKKIYVLLSVTVAQGNQIDGFFNSMFKTLGQDAQRLVSSVDIRLMYTSTGEDKPLREETENSLRHSWKLDNLRHLKFSDLEGLYLLTDEISTDFGKLEWLDISLANWERLSEQLKKRNQEVPGSTSGFFRSVKVLKILLETPEQNLRFEDDTGTFVSRFLAENLQYFPNLKEFGALGSKSSACQVSRTAGGEPTIGEFYAV
ncbi:hypothetical protein TWF281_003657 [Arthrobotrys megalospora]